MKWKKKGLIFEPLHQFEWMQIYGSVPTPFYIESKNIIRIVFTTSSIDKIGKLTYLDVDADNPSIIINKPTRIILDAGEPGTFDDCGVNPSCIIKVNNEFYLYYIGYQQSIKVPYMLFSGLAIGNSDFQFNKLQKVPIIDRNKLHPFSIAAPCVLIENGVFKMWIWIAKKWVKINGKDYLSAHVGYGESSNGIDWEIIKDDCITTDPSTEFSIGRPWVVRTNNGYRMFYSIRYIDKFYRLGYAESFDGLTWIRKDNLEGLEVSQFGWDSEMICYPSVITVKNKSFLFYNGNNHGATGFGYAELISE